MMATHSTNLRYFMPVKEKVTKAPDCLIRLKRELDSRGFGSTPDGNRLLVYFPTSLSALDKLTSNLRHWSDRVRLGSIRSDDTGSTTVVLLEK